MKKVRFYTGLNSPQYRPLTVVVAQKWRSYTESVSFRPSCSKIGQCYPPSKYFIISVSRSLIVFCCQLVCALRLVHLAGRTLVHGPLKFKVVFVVNCFVIYRQVARESLKLSFTVNYVLIKACWRLKNDFKLTPLAFDVVQKFEAVPHDVPEPVWRKIELLSNHSAVKRKQNNF